MKIGYFTDIHFRDAVPGESDCPERKSRAMKDVLGRCLEYFQNNNVGMIVCAGDIIDDKNDPRAKNDLETVRDMVKNTGVQSIIIPGNHDPDYEAFYTIFKQPGRAVRAGDCEFISFFDDAYAGNCECVRPGPSFEEMRALLGKAPAGITHTFLIQHFLIHPQLEEGCPFNHNNSPDIRRGMEESPRKLISISGHYHCGFSLMQHKGVSYFCGKAMSEAPFPCYIIDTEGGKISIREESDCGVAASAA